MLTALNLKPRDVTFALLVILAVNFYGFSTGGETPSLALYVGGSAVLVVGILAVVDQFRRMLVKVKNLRDALDED